MNLKVPIYFSTGLTLQANMYYKLLISCASQKIKDTYVIRNTFDFKHVCQFERSMINAPGPCVLFATPGMISGGYSVEVFKQWAPSELNLVTLPGYCVAGTIGHKLMSGKPTKINLDKDTQIDVRCQIHQLSFSPHTDGKGIMDLIGFLSPQHVILVHGEKPKMAKLKSRIQSELGIECHYPANNETVSIPTTQTVKVDATKKFIQNCSRANISGTINGLPLISESSITDMWKSSRDEMVAEAILVMEKTQSAKVLCEDEFLKTLGEKEHKLKCACCFPIRVNSRELLAIGNSIDVNSAASNDSSSLNLLLGKLREKIDCSYIQNASDKFQLKSLQVQICSNTHCPYRIEEKNCASSSVIFFCCSWSLADEALARKVLVIMSRLEF